MAKGAERFESAEFFADPSRITGFLILVTFKEITT
jgi:hypothetical protein